MKSKSYKNYKECQICKRTLPLTREYFARFGTGNGYHQICRDCEKKLDIEKEWKDGLLLCHDCLQYKEESEFTANATQSSIRHNRRHICNACNTERQRKHDVALSDNKKLIKCLRFRFLGARDRAFKKQIPFNVELEDLINLWNKQRGLCALSGIKMTFELKMGRTSTNVSIDKINKDLGYTKDNIQLVCMACNQMKSDLSETEMYQFCKNVVEHYENKNSIGSK